MKRGFLLGQVHASARRARALIQSAGPGRRADRPALHLLPDDPIRRTCGSTGCASCFQIAASSWPSEAGAAGSRPTSPEFWQIWTRHRRPGASRADRLCLRRRGLWRRAGGACRRTCSSRSAGASSTPTSLRDRRPIRRAGARRPVALLVLISLRGPQSLCGHGLSARGRKRRKSTLAERLAEHFGTTLVPEYGRSHCETHSTDCREADLMLIGEAQQASIERRGPGQPAAHRRYDALMTAAWSQMMIGYRPTSSSPSARPISI